jgi:Mor family transcriptional regulator
MLKKTSVNWTKDITPELLPEPYQTLAREIGLPHTLKLADLYQGTGFYLPRLDRTLAKIRNQRIREEFNGANHKELAIKYGITTQWIYKILEDQGVDEDQVSLFT